MQQYQVFHTPSASSSSSYTNSAGQGGEVDMREAIQRELEKEMIREKIIAEEVERKSVLEAQVRRELMIGREMMAMQNGRRGVLEPQPVDNKEIAPPLSKKKIPTPPSSSPAAAGSSQKKKMQWTCPTCEVSAPCKRTLQAHLVGKKHKAKAAVLSRKTTKSIEIKNSPECVPSLPAAAAACLTELGKKKMEWRCPICEVSASCESGLQAHLAGRKHQAKTVAGLAELTKKKMDWRCLICMVNVTCELDFQKHLAGKKHQSKLGYIRKGKQHLENLINNLVLQAVIGTDP